MSSQENHEGSHNLQAWVGHQMISEESFQCPQWTWIWIRQVLTYSSSLGITQKCQIRICHGGVADANHTYLPTPSYSTTSAACSKDNTVLPKTIHFSLFPCWIFQDVGPLHPPTGQMILGDAERSYPSLEDGPGFPTLSINFADRGNPSFKLEQFSLFFRPFFGGSKIHLKLSGSQTWIMIKIRIASKHNSILLIISWLGVPYTLEN